jgi:hypothetical protein
MIREEDFGGDSVEDVSVQVEGPTELRLGESSIAPAVYLI